MLITIAQKSTNEAQSEGVGCGGVFNYVRASFQDVAISYLYFKVVLVSNHKILVIISHLK